MSNRKREFASVLLLALILAPGCGIKDRIGDLLREEEKTPAAVRIGHNQYSMADLDRYFDNRLSEFRGAGEADPLKTNLLESFIEEKLLLTQAERLKVEPDPEALRTMLKRIVDSDMPGEKPDPERVLELTHSVANNLRVQQYLHEHLFANLTVPDEECEKFYNEHVNEYVRNDVVRLREILVDDLSLAEKIRGMLAASRTRNFGELARLHSKAASAGDGGELGTFQRGDLPQEFEKVVFSMAPGAVSRIVRTKYGYHIFQVEEKIRAHQQKFWEVKNQIKERLLREREREIINVELAALIKQIPVEIHREQLNFTYTGSRFSTR
jgi:parvulin-like peptidyl-prolyl isomerase